MSELRTARLLLRRWREEVRHRGGHRGPHPGPAGGGQRREHDAQTNVRSQRVMQRLGMRRELEVDHPRVPEGNQVRPHVLYRTP